MIKRTILGIILSFLIMQGVSRAQWVTEACPVKEDLNAVSFINLSQGWAVGDNGIIISKTNGSWTRCFSPVKEDLYSVAIISKDNGWAVGENGTIIRFNGYSWEKVESPTRNDLFAVSFKDPENGVITGENGTILVYSGKNWKQLDKNIKANLYAAQYLDEEIIFGGGMELLNVPLMKMSVRLGNSLNTLYDSNIAVTGLAFTDPDNAWIIGSPGVLLHYNGGSWIRPEINFKYPSLNHISLSNDNNGICVGFSGTILSLKEGNWTKEESGTNMHLNGSAIIGNCFYAVGDKGTILLKNQNSDNRELQPAEIQEEIIGLYPNPCKDFINVDLSGIKDNHKGTVCIMDLKGEVLENRTIDFSKPNLHLTFGTSDFKSGVYLIKVKSGRKILLSRFIVN